MTSNRAFRRNQTMLALALLACLVLLTACDWSMSGGNAAGTRFATGEPAISLASAPGLRVAWRASVNGPTNSYWGTNDPVVAGGVVYVTGPVAAGGALLYAFDAAGAHCPGNPSVCAPLWTAPIGAASTPAVANGLVWVNTGQVLVAFDARGGTNCSGTPKRCLPRFTATSPNSYFWPVAPIVANGIVHVPDAEAGIYGFDAAGIDNCDAVSGVCSPVFSAFPAPNYDKYAFASPAAARGCIFAPTISPFTESQDLLVADAGGYTNAGRFEARDSPVVAGTLLVVPEQRKVTVAQPSNPSGGCKQSYNPVWQSAEGLMQPSTAPAVANGVVFVGAQDGALYAFDLSGASCTGATAPRSCGASWRAPTGGLIEADPAVSADVVFVGSDDGKVSAFAANGGTGCGGTPRTCAPVWTFGTGGKVRSSPAIASGHVYVVSDDGNLYAFAPAR